MRRTKKVVCFSILVFMLCLLVTGCGNNNANNKKDELPKVNIDLDNDGICDVNCDTDEDGKCDKNCDNDNDGICDMNCDLNNDEECDLNCDTDNDIVADMYIDVNKDLVYDYEDIELIIKQGLANFKDTLEFYCPVDYGMSDCNKIVTEMLNKLAFKTLREPYQDILKTELNFDYGNINTLSYRVRVLMKYKYTRAEQRYIDEKIDTIIKSIITPELKDDKSKIKAIHDYIINNTSLCHDENGNIIFPDSDKNYNDICSNAGNIFTAHMANHQGYADLMALFLSKMNYENIRVDGDSHVWNAVKVDDVWYHIDLYWAKPISIDGNSTVTTHEYFMLTTDELNLKNDGGHIYDTSKYFMID